MEEMVILIYILEREEEESEHAHRDAISHRLRDDVVHEVIYY